MFKKEKGIHLLHETNVNIIHMVLVWNKKKKCNLILLIIALKKEIMVLQLFINL